LINVCSEYEPLSQVDQIASWRIYSRSYSIGTKSLTIWKKTR